MTEVNAALGLLQLKHITTVLARRQEISWLYRHRLKEVKGIKIPEAPSQSSVNHAYFPILVAPDSPLGRSGLYHCLKDNHIFSCRYFYPLITSFPMLPGIAPPRLRANGLRASW